jgi:hypothetical protein
MEQLASIVNELAPDVVVELAIDDPADASTPSLAPDAHRVLTLRAATRSAEEVDGVASLVRELDASPDLVIDHARGDVDRNRRYLEALFPLVRPGGLYAIVGETPTELPLELMFAVIAKADVLSEVVAGDLWLAVRRGVADLEEGTLLARDAFTDPARLIR